MTVSETIGFIGAGRMATALVRGLLNKGVPAKKLRAYDISKEASEKFATETGLKPSTNLRDALNNADIVILAVKPQNICEALSEACPFLKDKLLISIAAGIKIQTLIELSGNKRIVRVMPNTPALIGEGISAYSISSDINNDDIKKAEAILSAVGLVCKVDEDLMDAVTGLSGSGPAYVFEFIQALADGGIQSGLSKEIALKLAAQTVSGAAKLVIETGKEPSILRDQVKSPGGTTEKGLCELEKRAFKTIVSKAVIAAAKRSRELGCKH